MSVFGKAFSDKRFRYGTFSTVMVITAIALFALVNLVVDRLNISHDLTRDGLFTLSTGSILVAQNLDVDVTIYSLWPTGSEHPMFQPLLEQYATHSNRITVINRDPILHPQFVEAFAGPDVSVSPGSIIVSGPDRHRIIHANELTTMDVNWQVMPPQQFVRSINIEPLVTNAINFVMAAETPIIYHSTGNDEFELPPRLVAELVSAGYEVRTVNLLIEEVPEDTDILFLTMPGRDWSPDQAERIRYFLENNGRAVFIGGFRVHRFERMDEVLASFGIRLGDYVVFESNPNFFIGNTPMAIMPAFLPNEITENLIERNVRSLLLHSTGIDVLEMRRASTRIEPFAVTSMQAFGRSDPDAVGVTQSPNDIDGPFMVAATIEDHMHMGAGETMSTRMVVLGSDFVLVEDINAQIAGANFDMIINSLNWLREEPSRVFIPSRTPPTAARLMFTNPIDVIFIAAISVGVIPLFFGITGLVVWLRRRNA